MILGITPARGGSRGLKRKNIRECAGKPLLVWTIDAAEKSKMLGHYIVSTEDAEIAEVAQLNGAVVHPRPSALAESKANRWDVLKYHLKQFPDVTALVLLQATSPVRHDGLIDECINKFLAGGYDSYVTGYYDHGIPYPDNQGLNRQILGNKFFDDGNVYIWKREVIEAHEKQHPGKQWGYKITSREENIDINNEFDLWIAERVLNANISL